MNNTDGRRKGTHPKKPSARCHGAPAPRPLLGMSGRLCGPGLVLKPHMTTLVTCLLGMQCALEGEVQQCEQMDEDGSK